MVITAILIGLLNCRSNAQHFCCLDYEKKSVHLSDGSVHQPDLVVSTTSPDLLFDCDKGELAYVGREVFKIVLPIDKSFQMMLFYLLSRSTGGSARVTEFKKFTQHKSSNF